MSCSWATASPPQLIPGNRYAKMHIYLMEHTVEGRRAFVGLTMSWIERCVGNRRSRLAYAKPLPCDRAFDEGLRLSAA